MVTFGPFKLDRFWSKEAFGFFSDGQFRYYSRFKGCLVSFLIVLNLNPAQSNLVLKQTNFAEGFCDVVRKNLNAPCIFAALHRIDSNSIQRARRVQSENNLRKSDR